jgi:uncharacterized MAPEG superfamily protein
MSPELAMLALSGLLSLSLALLTIAIHGAAFGGPAIRGNRETYPALRGVCGRVVRAHASLNEALIPFATIVIATSLCHVSNTLTAGAAAVFLAARIAHASFYVGGVRILRSVSFYVALGATIVIAMQLPFSPAGKFFNS